MPTFTTNYSFNLPLVNDPTDEDLWGGQLNANWTRVDSILPAAVASKHGAVVVQNNADDGFEILSDQGTSGQILTSNGADALPSFQTVTIANPGDVKQIAGTTVPSGWVLCYGQAISRTTFSDLFAEIGTTYGAGDGSTTFNVPDLRGRVVAGQDDMGGVSANRLTGQSGGVDGDVLGAAGGAEQHTLIVSEMPSHTHTETAAASGGGVLGYGGVGTEVSRPTGSTGGDGAHNNVQPTIILNYIIKT